ncbi:MAG: non-homologous end-joining DNA ligase [Verrucomicrobia bacterium]|nr:non-homologous end-joining DNA ligase [Verrucomicrobiota bacterium]
MSLKEYLRKRDFEKTVEPNGAKASKARSHRFVIQKHAASRLHYDLRLELDGTLKSWAVPKGVPYAKGEKRLAVEVEDHPVSYINFEGIIPKGQYGGGTVMVWDQGTFEALSKSPSKDLAAGKLHFVLSGKKLSGEWYLVRLRDDKQWLLIRGKDNLRPVSKKMDDTSSLSGKNMKQLATGSDVWDSNSGSTKVSKATIVKKKPEPPFTIKFVEPMKARLVAAPPEGDWIYEIKHDGFRAIALKQGNQVRLLSRNEKDFAERFPEVAEAIREVPAKDAILDGEIVALDPKGRSSFQLLQSSDTGQERPAIFFYAFDLLQLNGRNLQKKSLTVRKALLEKLLKNIPGVLRYSASLEGNAAHLLKQARKLRLEGFIAKRKDSTYESGKRSGAWVKLKLHQQQEFVIGGSTPPAGSRQHFGALLVGYQGNKGLCFAGKVGTGFNEALLRSLDERFQKLEIPDCPFENLPEKKLGRFGQGITAGEMKKCRWLKPSLVCQVKFSEWTRDAKLRQPVFLGLREDKAAKEVIREAPQ